ncbi:nucleotidyltransferase domain-containing protein [candidate division TA06 bacterium]|nr:nucleotidyltransferase domain-containing protein [candidate division TA06 bacterium]
MAGIKRNVTLKDIQKIVQQMAERFHLQKVILFGSYAYGQPTEDSDVDLLVVMETDEKPLHVAARISASVDHPFPLEIIVRRPQDLKAYLAEKSVFETHVITNGIALYEAKD